MMSSFLLSSLISVPAYFAKSTRLPTSTSIAMRLPWSSFRASAYRQDSTMLRFFFRRFRQHERAARDRLLSLDRLHEHAITQRTYVDCH